MSDSRKSHPARRTGPSERSCLGTDCVEPAAGAAVADDVDSHAQKVFQVLQASLVEQGRVGGEPDEQFEVAAWPVVASRH